MVLMLADGGPAGGKRERGGMVLGRLLTLLRLLLHSAGRATVGASFGLLARTDVLIAMA